MAALSETERGIFTYDTHLTLLLGAVTVDRSCRKVVPSQEALQFICPALRLNEYDGQAL